jgi:hypothetical protein
MVVADGFVFKPLKQLTTTLPYQTGGEGAFAIVKIVKGRFYVKASIRAVGMSLKV